jgi:hypothetical protein
VSFFVIFLTVVTFGLDALVVFAVTFATGLAGAETIGLLAGFFTIGFFVAGLLAGAEANADTLETEGVAGLGMLLITFVFGALALGAMVLDTPVLGRCMGAGRFADMMVS